MATDVTLAGGAGEYMESATVVAWNAAPGAAVKAGEVIAVVETAKAATEIEAPCDGVLTEILAEVGAEVGIGAVLGRIGTAVEAPPPAMAVASAPTLPVRPAAEEPAGPEPGRVVASPLARRLAAQNGIDLAALTGTGPQGRIKSRDVERALAAGPARPASPILARPAAVAPPHAAAPIVLIHGFGSNAGAWHALLPRLSPAFATVRIELPGHGRQARRAGDIGGLIDSVLADLDAAGISAAHLVGHSLGGAVAAELAASGAFEAASLTLLAPAGLGPEIDGAFLDGFLRAREPASLKPWLVRLTADPAALPAGFAAAILRERTLSGLAEAQAALARALFPDGTQALDIRAALQRSAVPTRVLWGSADAIIPARHADSLRGAVAVHRLDGVGHMPHVEAPDLVARLVLETCRAAAFTPGNAAPPD